MSLFANDVAAAAEYRGKAVEVMGTLMGSVKAHGKAAKKSKAAADKDTILAHAVNIAAIVALGLVDDQYGQPDYRNTTTGPSYRKDLEDAGFSEAKAKLFWEYGQLAAKQPKTEDGDLTGIVAIAAKGDGKAVLKFLASKGVEKEADLKKIVQPVKTSIAEMVNKLTSKLSDAEFDTLVLDVMELRSKAAVGADKAKAEEAKALMNGIIAAVGQKAEGDKIAA